MEIVTLQTPLLDSNTHIIICGGHAFIVDPYWDERVSSILEQRVKYVDMIYLTHEHYDHISGIDEIREKYGCPVLCSDVCGKRIKNPTANFSRHFSAFDALQSGSDIKRMEIKPFSSSADIVFSNNHSLDWMGHNLYFFETPGHSPGSSCMLIDKKLLFCGDSISTEMDNVTRFPGGNAEDYFGKTVPKLRALMRDTLVYPGHYGSFLLHQRLPSAD